MRKTTNIPLEQAQPEEESKGVDSDAEALAAEESLAKAEIAKAY